MTSLTRETTNFYQTRHLPAPSEEIAATSPEELKAALRQLEADGQPYQLVGDGQHSRRMRNKALEGYTAVRTHHLNQVLRLDSQSGLIRVQAGMRWRSLQEAVRAHGFSLQRYGLHPATATIGGMLGRHRPGPPALRAGDLIDGCVALSAYSPKTGEYRYLDAPRKASGPDLRYHFIGAQGQEGAILSATLVIWRPVAQRLLRWEDCTLMRAAAIMDEIFRAGITPCCVHYGHRRQCLQIILAAPGQLLRNRVQWLGEKVGAPTLIGGDEEAEKRRIWLEARHPDRRSHGDAAKTRVVWLSPSILRQSPEKLFGDDLEDVEITSWTGQRVEAFIRYRDGAGLPSITMVPGEGYWAAWPMICQASR